MCPITFRAPFLKTLKGTSGISLADLFLAIPFAPPTLARLDLDFPSLYGRIQQRRNRLVRSQGIERDPLLSRH